MKHSKFYLVLLCLALLSYASCKKKKGNSEWEEFSLDSDYKDYVVAKNGSWYVFKDTVNSIFDTLTVANYVSEIKEISKEEVRFESVIFDLISKNSRSYKFTAFPANNKYLLVPWEINESGEKIFMDEFYFFSPSSVGDVEQGYGSTLYQSHFDSIEIQGKYYYDVREMVMIKSQVSDPKFYKKILWARNVGMIYREYHNGEVWELVNHYKAP